MYVNNVMISCIFLSVCLIYVECGQLCFPDNFKFGVATASHQIEGGWNASDKSENIWDRFTHLHPELIEDRSNADVADDSYHLYKQDVAMVKALGAQFYRFSISWPRVLPSGYSNYISSDGVRYYKELIEEILNNGLTPMVTMYHWDLPQSLQDIGGWTNPDIVLYFLDYAKVLLDTFGDKVNIWATINEPLSFCLEGYGGISAPGTNSSGIQAYLCGHNVLRAHGMVYRMFEREYKEKQNAVMGFVVNCPWMEPNTTSKKDVEAAERALQFSLGWFAHPIFTKEGDYPPVMRKRIDENSRRQHFSRSRLPTFTKDEVQTLAGSFDFLGYNHYTTLMVSYKADVIKSKPEYYDDLSVNTFQKPEWPKSQSNWLRVVPWGFRRMLNYLKKNYNNAPIIITENGFSTESGLRDLKRVHYMDSYLKSLHAAITEDKCNVLSYTHWSLMDNYEWMQGYTARFGLYEVDYNSPKRTRTPRLSAKYFKKLATTKCIPDDGQYYQ